MTDMKATTTESPNVKEDAQEEKSQDPMDFAANIEKVKEVKENSMKFASSFLSI